MTDRPEWEDFIGPAMNLTQPEREDYNDQDVYNEAHDAWHKGVEDEYRKACDDWMKSLTYDEGMAVLKAGRKS